MSFEHNGDVLSQQQTCLIVCRNALGIIMPAAAAAAARAIFVILRDAHADPFSARAFGYQQRERARAPSANFHINE
jgi:hypothetical protein